jgi:hypothetical protein
MSVSWGDRPGSIKSTSGPQSVTTGHVLTGTTSRTVAQALAAGYSPVIYSGLYRSNIALDFLGSDVWNVDVTYGPYERKEPEVGDFKWSFQTGGGTKHLTQSIATIARYPTAGAADHKGAIGLNENGDVEGVDIPEAAFEWTEDRKLLLASYGWTYSGIVGELTYKTNDAEFRGLPIGSVLFKGATGSQSAKDPLILELTYTFAYSPNVTGKVVGGITGISKKGWEYLWVEYQTIPGTPDNARLPKPPIQANVEQVYESGDFSLLGIGTT